MEKEDSKNESIKNLLESEIIRKNELKTSKLFSQELFENKFNKIKLKLKIPSLKNIGLPKTILKKNNFKISSNKNKTRNSVFNHNIFTLDSVSIFNNSNINKTPEKKNRLSLPKILYQTNTQNMLNLSYGEIKPNKKFKKTVTFNLKSDSEKKIKKLNKNISLSPPSIISPIKKRVFKTILINDNMIKNKNKEENIKYNTIINSQIRNKKKIKKQVTLDILKKTFNFSKLDEFSIYNKDLNFQNYPTPKISNNQINNIIKSFAVNSYKGLLRNYNEDKVSIILTINKPKNYMKKNWPKISLFAIYDGHGGNKCSDFLRDNLHNYIVKNNYFPHKPELALKYAFEKAENEFIKKAINEKDKSGSCSLVALIIDNIIYIANCGDSRALISINNGSKFKLINNIHNPNNEKEKERIILNGGFIYQSNNNIPRIIPGKLSVSRVIGDIYAKIEKENVLISEPEIYKINVLDKNDKIDFLLLGCDGIFDYLDNKDCIKCIWNVVYDKGNYYKNIHDLSLNIVNMVIKTALRRRTLDNVTCIFVGFENLEKRFLEENNNKMFLPSSDENRSLKYNVFNNNNNNIGFTQSVQLNYGEDFLKNDNIKI